MVAPWDPPEHAVRQRARSRASVRAAALIATYPARKAEELLAPYDEATVGPTRSRVVLCCGLAHIGVAPPHQRANGRALRTVIFPFSGTMVRW